MVEIGATHALQSTWTLWFDDKSAASSLVQSVDPTGTPGSAQKAVWAARIQKLASFDTIEKFAAAYAHLKRAHTLPKGASYHLFRGTECPSWELYPQGGCWILKLQRNAPDGQDIDLSVVWERILIACLSEEFAEPDLVGAVLSMRHRENILSIWTLHSDSSARFRISEKLKMILKLPPYTVLEFKQHSMSMKDGSSFKNGTAYVIRQE